MNTSLGTALYSDGLVHTYRCLSAGDEVRRGAPLCAAQATAVGESLPTDPDICAPCLQLERIWFQKIAATLKPGGDP